MKILSIKLLLLVLPVCLFIFICLFLPPNKTLKRSILFGQIDKNALLLNTKGPRIILIGGSSLAFGMDSKLIKDSLGINPINTGIHASVGLKYMLKNQLRFVRKGDIIIVAPEYHQFYNDRSNGESELLTMVFDVSPETISLLEPKQYVTLLKYIPKYVGSKLNPITILKKQDPELLPYDRKAFNKYGDLTRHWSLPRKPFIAFTIDGNIDNDAFKTLAEFSRSVKSKGATTLITYPAYQDKSFDLSKDKIAIIQQRLKKENFTILGSPERYRMSDTMFFDSQYHLTKNGAQLRTKLMIQDLQKYLKHPK